LIRFVIGVDFGTDSCRALIVNALTGHEIASSIQYYSRWKDGRYCQESINQYRQHPLDYLKTFQKVIRKSLSHCSPNTSDNIIKIGFDTTGCTPLLINHDGTPLALLPEFSENPNAMFILWKDHTSVHEAIEINELAHKWKIDYTSYEGGNYSSE
jgi:L-ribulokinase